MSSMHFGSFQAVIPLLQLQLPTLIGLPDEVLRLIIKQLPASSLSSISLVSKHLRRLVLPELFAELSLSQWTAQELDQFYELFLVKRGGDGDGDDKPSVLGDMHLRSVSYQLSAEVARRETFKADQGSMQKVLGAMRGIEHLDIELDLVDDAPGAFIADFLPAIVGLIKSVKGKTNKIDLHVGSYQMGDDSDGAEEDHVVIDIAAKVSMIIECFQQGKLDIAGLHFTGLGLTELPDTIHSAIISSALTDLTLIDCGPAFTGVASAVGNLKELTMAWGMGLQPVVASLDAALRYMQGSSNSLELISLHDYESMNSDSQSFAGLVTPLVLPKVTRLQLGSDSPADPTFLLDRVLKNVQLSLLKILILELGNLLSPAFNLSLILDKMPSLSKITLEERPRADEPGVPIHITHMQALEQICRDRDIILETSTLIQCNDVDELKHQFDRLSALSATLKMVSLNCQSFDTLRGLHKSVRLSLPKVQHLMVGLTDMRCSTSPHMNLEGHGGEELACSVLGDLLEHIHAPNLKVLELTLLSDTLSIKAAMTSLQTAIKDRLYPNLEVITGAMIPFQVKASDTFISYEEKLRALCAERGIDASGLTPIDRSKATSDQYGDDESIHSDTDQSEPNEDERGSEVDDIYDSDESGFSESNCPMKTIAEEDEENDYSDPDYIPSETETGDDDTSSDTSWTTDDDDVDEA